MKDSVYDYRFECEALSKQLSDDEILVTEWEGTEGVSQLYRFEIRVAVHGSPGVKLDDLLDQRATLKVRHPDGTEGKWHGIITECAQDGRDKGYSFYRLVLEPRLARLGLRRWTDIYLEKTLGELIEETLKEARLTTPYADEDTPYDYRITVPQNELARMRRNFVCQFEETCLNFLLRKLEFYGVYFWFDQGDDRESVVFGNAHTQQPSELRDAVYYPSELTDPDPNSVALLRLDRCASMAPERVSLRALNDHDNTKLEMHADAQVEGVPQGRGRFESVSDHFLISSGSDTPVEQGVSGETLAKWRAEELACHILQVRGEAHTAGVRAGRYLVVREHGIGIALEGEQYYVTQAQHRGVQPIETAPSREGLTYKARFVALPRWRDQKEKTDPVQFRPARVTPVPRVSRLVTGFIDIEDKNNPKRHAQPDREGRYKVWLPFVRQRHDPYKNSAWLRRSTPYAGGASIKDLKQAGLHLPLREGTEVLIAFLNEDPDLPVIVGSLPNIEAPSVVGSMNAWEHVLRTPDGSEFSVNEEPSQIKLYTPATNASMILGAVQGVTPPANEDEEKEKEQEKGGDGKKKDEFPTSMDGFQLRSDASGEIFAGKYLEITVPGHYAITAGKPRSGREKFADSSWNPAPGVSFGHSAGFVLENFFGVKMSFAEAATTDVTLGLAGSSFAGGKADFLLAGSFSMQATWGKEVNLRAKQYIQNEGEWKSAWLHQKILKSELVAGEKNDEALDYGITAYRKFSLKGLQTTFEHLTGLGRIEISEIGDVTIAGARATLTSTDMALSGATGITVASGTSVLNMTPLSISMKSTAGPVQIEGNGEVAIQTAVGIIRIG
ncbi:type VI secretion system tip protein VgrG [bacterium SGD-2]|nr:type VI secretion system tip protein VgrG [bacterium SGD-2]